MHVRITCALFSFSKMNAFVILRQSYLYLWMRFMPILFILCVLWLKFFFFFFSVCMYCIIWQKRIIKDPYYTENFGSGLQFQRNYRWAVLRLFQVYRTFWTNLQQMRTRKYSVSKSKIFSYRRRYFHFISILFISYKMTLKINSNCIYVNIFQVTLLKEYIEQIKIFLQRCP